MQKKSIETNLGRLLEKIFFNFFVNFLCVFQKIKTTFNRNLKGNARFVQKLTFEILIDFKQNHYGS